jgi:uncharacterized membrane protein
MYSPILIIHICGGTVGLLSGAAAMILRKGSRRHRLAGDVFVVSMLIMASAAVYLALARQQRMNVFAGLLTLYMVITAWLTAKRKPGQTSRFDWAGFVVALAIGIIIAGYGVAVAKSPGRPKDGVPSGMYFFSASVALLAAAGDLRMIVAGGVSGTRRLVRHLWRMSYALFVASGSIFIARPHLFPAILRRTYILPLLGIMPLLLLIFWTLRVKFSRAYRRPSSLPANANPAKVTSLRQITAKVGGAG